MPGAILEFGVHYGATLSTLVALRGIHEPFNYNRRFIGFDMFGGFPSIGEKDGDKWGVGDYGVPSGYVRELSEILELQDKFSPIDHVVKTSLIEGDASETFPLWLDSNPGELIALAILDLDVYGPTKDVLKLLKGRMCAGSVIVFDEVSYPEFPGETVALLEEFEISTLGIEQSRFQPRAAWVKV